MDDFHKYSGISEYINLREEVLALRDVMQLVQSFMTSKLILHLRSWNKGYFFRSNDFIDVFIGCIGRMSDGLLGMYRRQYYKEQGLTGLIFDNSMFANYFEKSFFKQLRKYFKITKRRGDCSTILYVDYLENRRWEDGSPGDTIAENFMFSGIILYMIMTEQGILKYSEEASKDFHQASEWPLICSGPGAGPYLHPLKFIEHAGLLPRKSEASLYLEMVKDLFPFMQQKVNELLNGNGIIKDSEAGKRFFNAIRGHNSHVKDIKRYIKEQEEQIIKLLKLWSNGQHENCLQLLNSQDIPVQMNF